MSTVDSMMTEIIAQEISRNTANLENIYSSAVTNYNKINNCIETLRRYNGCNAGGIELLNSFTILEKKWQVTVNKSFIYNPERTLNEIAENIELLNVSGEDLMILSEKLEEYMNELSLAFNIRTDPNPLNFFNELACKDEWQNKKYDYLYSKFLEEMIMDKLLEKGYFIKYNNLTEEQYIALARVCAQEQGSNNLEGIATEASLICNLYEYNNKGYDNIYDFVKHTGWWHKSSEYMDGNAAHYDNPINDEIINIVKEVFCDGRRTLPVYINEHDDKGDLSYIDTNGVQVSPKDASSYVQNVSICVQNPERFEGKGTSYLFYRFAGGINKSGNAVGDPFGTADWGLDKKEEYGDFHMDFKTGNLTYNDNDLNKILSNEEIINIDKEITSKIEKIYGIK